MVVRPGPAAAKRDSVMRTDSTGVKLGVAFGFLIALLIGVSWLALTRTRQIDSGSNKAFTVALVLAAIAVAIGIAVDVTLTLSRDSKARERDRLEIRELNRGLERKAAERKEDLARTVETLKGEVFERRAREGDQRRLAAIVEYSDDAIVAASLDGIITEWNAGAERMFGYSREEIIGKPLSLITPEELRDEIRESQEKLLRGVSV